MFTFSDATLLLLNGDAFSGIVLHLTNNTLQYFTCVYSGDSLSQALLM